MHRLSRFGVVGLLVLVACGSGVDAGVNLKSVATDLVYGIPEEEIPAAPANIGTPPDDPVGVVFSGGTPNEDDERPEPPPQPPAPECPAAPLDDFPDAATSRVEGRPEPGEYMWRVEGTEETALLGRVQLPRSTRRQITGVVSTQGDDFQFVTVERDLRFGSRTTIETTYEVRVEDGIYITRIERSSESGTTGLFEPIPAVLVFPLPMELGAEFSSTGIDPNSFEVLRHTGAVGERKRVDACGEMVDSFLVDGEQEFISASGETTRRNYDYGVAPHLGGIIVFEHVDAPCTNEDDEGNCDPEPTLTFDAHIGQLDPDPE